MQCVTGQRTTKSVQVLYFKRVQKQMQPTSWPKMFSVIENYWHWQRLLTFFGGIRTKQEISADHFPYSVLCMCVSTINLYIFVFFQLCSVLDRRIVCEEPTGFLPTVLSTLFAVCAVNCMCCVLCVLCAVFAVCCVCCVLHELCAVFAVCAVCAV